MALYWPIEWPAWKAGGPRSARRAVRRAAIERAVGRDRCREQRRLGVDGEVELLGRAFPGQRARWARRAPRRPSCQTAAASVEPPPERPSHAHRLRALAGIDVGRRQDRVSFGAGGLGEDAPCADGTARVPRLNRSRLGARATAYRVRSCTGWTIRSSRRSCRRLVTSCRTRASSRTASPSAGPSGVSSSSASHSSSVRSTWASRSSRPSTPRPGR